MYQIENAHSYYVPYNQYSVFAGKSYYSQDAQAGGALRSSKSPILSWAKVVLGFGPLFQPGNKIRKQDEFL